MNFLKETKCWIIKNEPELMLSLGITGMATTIILSMKASIKVNSLIERKKIEENRIKLPKKEIIKTGAKYYIAPAITFSLSTACLIASYKVNSKRNAILASALATSQAALTEYQEHVIKAVGTDVEKIIKKDIAADKINELESRQEIKNVIYPNEKGLVEAYESTTQRRFQTDYETIRKVINDLNQDRLTGIGGEVTFNDFYEAIGLDRTSSGDILGWTIDAPVTVDISAVEHNGIPFLYIKPNGWSCLKAWR